MRKMVKLFWLPILTAVLLLLMMGCGSYDEVPLNGQPVEDELNGDSVPEEEEQLEMVEEKFEEGPSEEVIDQLEAHGFPVEDLPFPGGMSIEEVALPEEAHLVTFYVSTEIIEEEKLLEALADWYQKTLEDQGGELEITSREEEEILAEGSLGEWSLEFSFILFRSDMVEVSLRLE